MGQWADANVPQSGGPGTPARRWLRRLLPQRLRRVVQIGHDLGFRAGIIHLRQRWARACAGRRWSTVPSTAPVHSLVFVCHGNIIRSPFAAALLRKQLAHRRAEIRVASAGLRARPAREADPRARALAPQFGICLDDHRATPLTPAMVEENDLLLVMDYHNEAELLTRFPNARGKVWLLREYVEPAPKDAEIPDPYLGDEADLRRVCQDLQRCVEELARRLFAGDS
ncbi:MAG: low molecular weight phosphotyrosine protein phosphatase [Firmicutes bacterium]|nr:low molecular weight phosphotyrosine protein phosphatase [Bacillota bacterium]